MRLEKMRRLASPLMLCAALSVAGCNADEPQVSEPAGDTLPLPEPAAPLPTGHGTIGPVSYTFDDTSLTRAELEVPIPPDFRTNVWAVKLIPTARAEMLGEIACHYGGDDAPEACTARQEPGLSLAMLERPIADYRENFAASGYGEEKLGSTEIGGRIGFAFTAEQDGDRVEYRFVPVSGRTLLIAEQGGPGVGEASQAIGAVLAGLRLDD